MKRSNVLLILLSAILLGGLLTTDYLLAIQYTKINLNDPYKNFQLIPLQPFKALKVRGGNGYAIRILQGDSFNIRLMNSRKSFFKMEKHNDTLSVVFTVANQNYQLPQASTTGLIITMPRINFLQLSGTNNEVGPFRQDSLEITQDKNTFTRAKKLDLKYLKMEATGISHFDFELENSIDSLNIQLENTAMINFIQVNFKTIAPVLQDSAAIILYRQSLGSLNRAGFMSQDSLLLSR